jgi:hypothetical protein
MSIKVATMGFAFPAAGDPIEALCRGQFQCFRVDGVHVDDGRTWVTVWDPCPNAVCTEHIDCSDYAKFPMWAIRPHVSG